MALLLFKNGLFRLNKHLFNLSGFVVGIRILVDYL